MEEKMTPQKRYYLRKKAEGSDQFKKYARNARLKRIVEEFENRQLEEIRLKKKNETNFRYRIMKKSDSLKPLVRAFYQRRQIFLERVAPRLTELLSRIDKDLVDPYSPEGYDNADRLFRWIVGSFMFPAVPFAMPREYRDFTVEQGNDRSLEILVGKRDNLWSSKQIFRRGVSYLEAACCTMEDIYNIAEQSGLRPDDRKTSIYWETVLPCNRYTERSAIPGIGKPVSGPCTILNYERDIKEFYGVDVEEILANIGPGGRTPDFYTSRLFFHHDSDDWFEEFPLELR